MTPLRDNLHYLILMTLVCLLLGVVTGVAVGKAIPSSTITPEPAAEKAGPTATFTGQISVLLLVVDSLASPLPVLEGCWVLTYQSGVPVFYLVGYSPDTTVYLAGSPTAQTLGSLYADDAQIKAGRSQFTRDALQIISPGLLRPQGEIILDRRGLADGLNRLGGIEIDGQLLDAAALFALYDALPADEPMQRLLLQEKVVTSLTRAPKLQAWSLEALTAYFHVGQQWNPNLEWYLSLAKAELPLSDPSFFITSAPIKDAGHQ